VSRVLRGSIARLRDVLGADGAAIDVPRAA
jgi:hypothetical protein